jgi:glycerol uptake facilitator-like aquaporin
MISRRALGAECLGTALLLAAVIGSGIMGERLAGGNVAIALLANTVATGAILFVLITALGPVSGAHFNPAVTLVFVLRREIGMAEGAGYALAQTAGGFTGVVIAHLMFGEAALQISTTARTGVAQWLSEGVAAFGLVLTILMVLKARADAVATAVGLYIVSAYWFTASTSFANPAVTVARGFSDTFAGIRPADTPMFIVMQLAGALAALVVARFLLDHTGSKDGPR